MIQPNELRIGNYIQYNGKIEEVVDLLCDSVNTHTGVFIYDDIAPVRITSELLERCGFEKELLDHVYLHRKKRIAIEQTHLYNAFLLGIETAKGEYVGLGEIESLHRLQGFYFDIEGEQLKFIV